MRQFFLRLSLCLFAFSAAMAHAAEGQLPILFVHGNGDDAAVWETTIWRFESNGYDPSLLSAIDFAHPSARAADHAPEDNRSSSADQLADLSSAIDKLLAATGQTKLILVGSSRGGYAIRNFIRHGGQAKVAMAILCGTPNHGVFALPFKWDLEFNGIGPFLRDLNKSETDAGVTFVTLRSDHNDKYAQPTGKYVGFPYLPTFVWSDGPALKGADNIVLPGLDHREVAFHRSAFAAIYQAITGAKPATLDPIVENAPVLSGKISGFENGAPTNLPLPGVTMEIYQVDPASGERTGGALWHGVTGADGRWGPFTAAPDAYYEFVVTAQGYPVTHLYEMPFLRSSPYVHIRLEPQKDDAGFVTLSRPRGYFGKDRDKVTIDGQAPDNLRDGVPALTTARLHIAGDAARTVMVTFNDAHFAVKSAPTDRVVAELRD